ncbi:hypothetical protein N7466_001557 [Penicillium verhagenii]|uniref:uncharacterized protein n=1 Tax=Penicillium verhagenii TaxID=1562060 RepID=UPI0025458246|nr:uncharacterized protein N7466_001557 [Penicillium verhagenii]KAJ5938423.1 hypothetical protein N7466_001557 [Penicillium verhagenii]
MSPRGTTSWSEREEESLLPWLDENRALPWKALPEAYSEKFGVNRTVESLRGKKYHILRKKGCTNARSLNTRGRRKRPGPPGPRRRAVEKKASHSDAIVKAAPHSNIDQWFETILTSELFSADSSESMLEEGSISGMRPKIMSKCMLISRIDHLKPALTSSLPKTSRSSSWIWEYVHRVCAIGKVNLYS